LGILIIGSQYRAQFWWFVCINFRLCVLLMQEEVRNLYWALCRENVDHMEWKVYQHARNAFKWRALSTWYQVVTVLSLWNECGRKLRSIGAPDLGLAGRSRVVAGVSGSMAQSDEQEEVVGWDEAKTRCPCGNSVDKGTMIQVTCCCHWFLIVLLWKQDTAHPIFVSKLLRISRCAALVWKFSWAFVRWGRNMIFNTSWKWSNGDKWPYVTVWRQQMWSVAAFELCFTFREALWRRWTWNPFLILLRALPHCTLRPVGAYTESWLHFLNGRFWHWGQFSSQAVLWSPCSITLFMDGRNSIWIDVFCH
jgi:hypothetical protein